MRKLLSSGVSSSSSPHRVPLRKTRLVVCGEKGVGKTAVASLLGKHGAASSDANAAFGGSSEMLLFEHRLWNVDESLSFDVWDFNFPCRDWMP